MPPDVVLQHPRQHGVPRRYRSGTHFPNQALRPVRVTVIISLSTVMIDESGSWDLQPVRDFALSVFSSDGWIRRVAWLYVQRVAMSGTLQSFDTNDLKIYE